MIPLTGVTLPFVSYGGSSIVANFVIVALLLLVSDRARREARGVNAPIVRIFGVVLVLFGVLVVFTSRWTVHRARRAARQPAQQARAARAGSGSRAARSSPPTARRWRARRAARDGTYTRRYPQAGRFAQTVGYAYLNPGTAGLERRYNGELLGRDVGIERALRRLQGERGAR